MLMQESSVKKVKILDEIIDNATELPLESQDWLLLLLLKNKLGNQRGK